MNEHDPVAKAGYPHQSEMTSSGANTTFTYSVPNRTVAVGRIVLFHPANGDQLPTPNHADAHPAIITRVWSDEMVNLMVFPDAGTPVARTSVPFGDAAATAANCWSWPY